MSGGAEMRRKKCSFAANYAKKVLAIRKKLW